MGERVQGHPTGLVHPDEPDAKVKFLAAEALRGCGGVLLDINGNRFANELGRRDYVTGMMWKNKGVQLGSTTGFFLCFEAYGGGKSYDKWGKKFFHNLPLEVEDHFHVAIVTPVIHYCMGGMKINADAQAMGAGDKILEGLYATGEAAGGIHGNNRLGGNSLLDCVVYGRVSGRSAARFLTAENIKYIASMKSGAGGISKL